MTGTREKLTEARNWRDDEPCAPMEDDREQPAQETCCHACQKEGEADPLGRLRDLIFDTEMQDDDQCDQCQGVEGDDKH